MEELKRDFTIVIVTHNMQQAARVSDRTAFFTAEVDDARPASRPAGRVRRHREALHRSERSPHRGLHHRAIRLSPLRREQSADVARCGARSGPSRRRSGRSPSAIGSPPRSSISADGVIVVDADGREVFRNAAAERYREARHTDAVAAGADHRAARHARAGQTRANASCSSSARRARCSSSRRIPLVGRRCRSLGAAVFVHDVSEIHRVESVRRDFVANVSHELKTPIGALELLAETLAVGDRPGGQRRLAESLVKEADRLGRIVDDLLDLSLIETQESPAASRCRSRVLARGRGRARAARPRPRRGSRIEVDDDAPGRASWRATDARS